MLEETLRIFSYFFTIIFDFPNYWTVNSLNKNLERIETFKKWLAMVARSLQVWTQSRICDNHVK